MAESGTGGTSSLIEVTRVLVQQRWQNGAADHDVREAIRSDCAKALSICSPALAIVWSISGLLGSGYKEDSRSRNSNCRDLQRQIELHPCRQRRRIALIGNIKIPNDSEHALLCFAMKLCFSNFDSAIMNITS